MAKTSTSKSTSKVQTKSKKSFIDIFPWILIIPGAIGLVSAITLVVEKIHLLQNPGASLACDLNPIVACGSVIGTPQASAFGFPNPLIGVAGFAVMITIGAGLLAGATFKRWFWLGAQAGTVFAVAFMTWLQYQSIYNIGALCPFCMIVWSVAIILFVYTLVYNIRQKHIVFKDKLAPIGAFISKYHVEIIITWYLVIFLAILERFWYYWSTLI